MYNQKTCKLCGKPIEWISCDGHWYPVNLKYTSIIVEYPRHSLKRGRIVHSETCSRQIEKRSEKAKEKIKKIREIVENIK